MPFGRVPGLRLNAHFRGGCHRAAGGGGSAVSCGRPCTRTPAGRIGDPGRHREAGVQTLTSQDPPAVAVTEAIRTGDLPGLRQLLADHPALATARITEQGEDGRGARSLLHIATDWPGHFPRGPEVVAALVAAGADPRARFDGARTETPLHRAASNNDVPVLDALIEAGADIEAPGAVIGGGTPLADARGFGQWRAAHRLVEHGARVTLQTPPRSACSTGSGRTSRRTSRRRRRRSPAPSGAPAAAGTCPPRSTSANAAPTPTGAATTARPRSASPAPRTPTTSCAGCATWARRAAPSWSRACRLDHAGVAGQAGLRGHGLAARPGGTPHRQ